MPDHLSTYLKYHNELKVTFNIKVVYKEETFLSSCCYSAGKTAFSSNAKTRRKLKCFAEILHGVFKKKGNKSKQVNKCKQCTF